MPRSTLTSRRDDEAPPFGAATLALDAAAEVRRLELFISQTVVRALNRRGAVLGVSGGIDSAVCSALAVRALGPERVLALLMPEHEGSDAGMERAARLCRGLGVTYVVEDIGRSLEAIGCYRRRDAAIAGILPAYGEGWRHKIVLGGATRRGQLPHFHLVAESPAGERSTHRLPLDVYLQLVAATNFKQRIRKNIEYYHAERLNYAVIGTPNRLEYALGFFVRGGDGLADLKPIAHLYKSQVYALAGCLGIPEEIRRQPPSTDTYSLPQTQEEFYFALPYDKADLVLYGMENGVDMGAVAAAVGLGAEQVEQARNDFVAKRKVARRTARDAIFVGGDDGADAQWSAEPAS